MARPGPRLIAAIVFLGAVIAAAASGAALPKQAEDCAMCHTGDDDSAPALKVAGYENSAHADIECGYCHQGAESLPHPNDLPPVDCGMCHADAVAGIRSSPHGKMILEKAKGSLVDGCLQCHGGTPHSVRRIADEESPVCRDRQVDLCGSCHDKPDATPARLERRKPVESYKKTVHGLATCNGKNGKAALCADCHGNHDIRPGTDSASKVSRARIAETCGRCHEKEATAYSRSVHGRGRAEGVKESPTCTDCHGEHDMVSVASAASKVSSATVSATCSGCHASERIVGKLGLKTDRVGTFEDSYHGLAAGRGARKAANCASCHGWHEILPSNDPASSIHPSHLSKTCGQCHPGADISFGSVSVHTGLSNTADATVVAQWVRWFYFLLIPMVIGGMLFHNGADLLRKSIGGSALPPLKKHTAELLLTPNERVQHAGLAITFLLLALTGFALEFPEFGSRPGWFIGDEAFRRWIHRGAAIVFLIVGVWHGLYLAFSKKGRERLRALLPALRDGFDPMFVTLSNLGFRVNRPVLPRWSYIEKAEYWALIWGSFVMLVTGAVLAFDNESLAHLPLWVIEASQVIHYLEAVLACLAIIVWHWYWAIFDPHIYPMNWAWLTGREKWNEGERNKESGHE
jgi:cytochrome b subunit of formate dehydrogenase